MERSIEVNRERCVHCGLCVGDCGAKCLAFDEEKFPTLITGGGRGCMGCQHCMAICPAGAISVGGVDPDGLPAAVCADPDELLGMIRSRRSVRAYKEEDVSAEKLEKIREMLHYPPTGGNLDNLHFTIIGTREKMDGLRRATYGGLSTVTEDSPLFGMKDFLEEGWSAGRDIIYAGAPAMIMAAVSETMFAPNCDIVDPIIALSYFELFASSLGLGTLWDDCAYMAAKAIPEVCDMLRIPEGYRPAFALVFGEPETRYRRAAQKDAHSITML